MRTSGEPTGPGRYPRGADPGATLGSWPGGQPAPPAARAGRLADVAPAGLIAALKELLATPSDPRSLDRCRRAVVAHARRARRRGEPADETISMVHRLLEALQPNGTDGDRELASLILWRTIRWVESEEL